MDPIESHSFVTVPFVSGNSSVENRLKVWLNKFAVLSAVGSENNAKRAGVRAICH